jgi:hypothetical protein
MVIDVALLLDLPDDRAATVPTGDKAREREVVFYSPVLFKVAAIENALNALPQFLRHHVGI